MELINQFNESEHGMTTFLSQNHSSYDIYFERLKVDWKFINIAQKLFQSYQSRHSTLMVSFNYVTCKTVTKTSICWEELHVGSGQSLLYHEQFIGLYYSYESWYSSDIWILE